MTTMTFWISLVLLLVPVLFLATFAYYSSDCIADEIGIVHIVSANPIYIKPATPTFNVSPGDSTEGFQFSVPLGPSHRDRLADLEVEVVELKMQLAKMEARIVKLETR